MALNDNSSVMTRFSFHSSLNRTSASLIMPNLSKQFTSFLLSKSSPKFDVYKCFRGEIRISDRRIECLDVDDECEAVGQLTLWRSRDMYECFRIALYYKCQCHEGLCRSEPYNSNDFWSNHISILSPFLVTNLYDFAYLIFCVRGKNRKGTPLPVSSEDEHQ